MFAVRASDEGSLGEEDSNPRSWDQNPVSYQLDDPPPPHGRGKVAHGIGSVRGMRDRARGR